MSTKRVKQYLMLLTAIGLIAIASGGSGTFASFTAEVANPGNTFATGTLYLHDTANNGTECTSESAPSNTNVPATVGGVNPGDQCNYLFTVPSSQFAPNALLWTNGAGLTGTISSIPVRNWANGAGTGTLMDIADGSEVEISGSGNSDICTVSNAGSPVAAGSTAIPVSSCVLAHSYADGATISSDGPFIGHLILRNAGTIDGSDLKFQLNGDATTSCDVTPGPSTATTLCDHLDFAVTETTSSWTATIDPTSGDITGAARCDYGPNAGSAGGCSPDNSFPLSGVKYRGVGGNQGLDSLDLKTGGGHANLRQPLGLDSTLNHPAGGGFPSGGTRYFLVEIWPGDLVNDDMGASTTFDLVWHMDQA